jgi:hypothetical protein
MNPQVVKLLWVLAQGVFLPVVLWMDDLRSSGNYGAAIGVFLSLEALYIADALLFLRIFKGK